jgi:thiol-disulfide isomerase/thioredoxin
MERVLRSILLLMAFAAIAGCSKPAPESPPAETAVGAEAGAPTKGVDRSHAGKPAPEIEMMDADETTASLASLRGKPLLVNFWAIWCAPCVKEQPTREALSKQPGAPKLIAVSEDSATRATVDAFLDDHKLELEAWRDPDMAATAIGVQILPTTILYGSDGKEIWRYSGDLDWTGAEAKKLLAEAR